jgi:hypothetical protein
MLVEQIRQQRSEQRLAEHILKDRELDGALRLSVVLTRPLDGTY